MNNQIAPQVPKQTEDKYIIKDRVDYMTMAETVAITKLSEYGAKLCSALIGFRFDPDNPGAYLFHRDDVNRFLQKPSLEAMLQVDILTDPEYKHVDEDSFVDRWLVRKTTRLCEYCCEGAQSELEDTSDEINTKLREVRS